MTNNNRKLNDTYRLQVEVSRFIMIIKDVILKIFETSQTITVN